MPNQPVKKTSDCGNTPIRETSMYQTCGPKATIQANQDPNTAGEQGHCETMRTISPRTRHFGYQDVNRTPKVRTRQLERCTHLDNMEEDPIMTTQRLSTRLPEQLILNQGIDQYQKIAECPTYDVKFPSSHPSIGVYSESKFRTMPAEGQRGDDADSDATREKRRLDKEIYRRWVCLIEPYWTRETTAESDVDIELERSDLVDDLLLKQEMSEAECDWDRNECY
uniref:Uncharacterized protein n=1 Tax=Parasteatoda tepidariorum TaxID=114398 RepID=A0A2L2YWU8_PARTP